MCLKNKNNEIFKNLNSKEIVGSRDNAKYIYPNIFVFKIIVLWTYIKLKNRKL